MLETWLADPDPGVSRPRHPILVKLFLGERVELDRVQALLVQYRAQTGIRRDSLAAAAAEDAAAIAADPASPRRFGRAAALFGLRRAEADLAWIDEVLVELRLPSKQSVVGADDHG